MIENNTSDTQGEPYTFEELGRLKDLRGPGFLGSGLQLDQLIVDRSRPESSISISEAVNRAVSKTSASHSEAEAAIMRYYQSSPEYFTEPAPDGSIKVLTAPALLGG